MSQEDDFKKALSTSAGAAECSAVWALKAATATDPKESAEWAAASVAASETSIALAQKGK